MSDIDAITVRAAAARLGVSGRVVRRMIARRELTSYRFAGSGLVRVDAGEVDAKTLSLPSRVRESH